jgi:hypothetical protein
MASPVNDLKIVSIDSSNVKLKSINVTYHGKSYTVTSDTTATEQEIRVDQMFKERVTAMAQLHEKLSESHQYQKIEIKATSKGETTVNGEGVDKHSFSKSLQDIKADLTKVGRPDCTAAAKFIDTYVANIRHLFPIQPPAGAKSNEPDQKRDQENRRNPKIIGNKKQNASNIPSTPLPKASPEQRPAPKPENIGNKKHGHGPYVEDLDEDEVVDSYAPQAAQRQENLSNKKPVYGPYAVDLDEDEVV